MIFKYRDYLPDIEKAAFIADNSMIIGRCSLGFRSSIWFNAVLRADVNEIVIGEMTNIQDGVVIHCDHAFSTNIGNYVTVGHNAVIHGCCIKDNCIIGMGSTILDGATIGENCIIGANSLITSGKSIPDNSLVMGSPARVVRVLSEAEIETIKKSSEGYFILASEYSGAQSTD